MCHGIFSAFEKATDKATERAWRPLGHLYLLLFHVTTMVFFRVSDLAAAGSYIGTMYGIIRPDVVRYGVTQFISNSDTIIAMALALIGTRAGGAYSAASIAYLALQIVFYGGVLLLSAMALASDTYTPFLYRQF